MHFFKRYYKETAAFMQYIKHSQSIKLFIDGLRFLKGQAEGKLNFDGWIYALRGSACPFKNLRPSIKSLITLALNVLTWFLSP